MAAGGPWAGIAAFRKLRDLHARTSYSHRGGYYTLDELVDFDEHGLWAFASVRSPAPAPSSRPPRRSSTTQKPDTSSTSSTTGSVSAPRTPCCNLVGDGRLTRHKLAGQFLYCATDHAQETHQLRAPPLLMATPGLGRPLPDTDVMPEELRAAIVLFASLLDERQRRTCAGLESLKCAWGRRPAHRLPPRHRSVHGRHRPPAARRPRCRGRPGATRGRRTTTDGKKHRKSSPASKP